MAAMSSSAAFTAIKLTPSASASCDVGIPYVPLSVTMATRIPVAKSRVAATCAAKLVYSNIAAPTPGARSTTIIRSRPGSMAQIGATTTSRLVLT